MATKKKNIPVLLLFHHLLLILPARAQLPGTWETVTENAGVASMHTAVTHRNTVVLLDRTDIGPTKRLLGNRRCRRDPRDSVLKLDCYAHSAELDLATGEIRPLTVLTDTWCSSGQFLPNGTLLQTGGGLDGIRKIRLFRPCRSYNDLCDWSELAGEDHQLAEPRWYATNQILPDGTVIIIGGRGSNSVEYFPPNNKKRPFPFLAEAEDAQMDNLYPFVHLLPDGNLFVFANDRAVAYDFISGEILRRYPTLEGGPRNYPSGGSSAMLPLSGDFSSAEIIVCGGARYGAFLKKDSLAPASNLCGRIVATSPATWQTETMPSGRIMGDMVNLPSGDILIVNGAERGSQGFDLGSGPALNPVLYRPAQPPGLRFMTLSPGSVPRLYHSTANLLPDGRVLLAGSNPHMYYKFEGVEFPTELRIEAFSPEYLAPGLATLRPAILDSPERVGHGESFEVVAAVPLPLTSILEVNLVNAPFVTHSFSQGQRVVKLAVSNAVPVGGPGTLTYKVSCVAPPHGAVAPPGYYMAFVVNQGVPSVARWMQIVAP